MRGLTDELAAAGVDSLLVNIHEEPGLTLRERFDFAYSPTYLVFRPGGEVVLRRHTLPTLADIQAALSP